MFHVSAQGVDERMIKFNVHYYYYFCVPRRVCCYEPSLKPNKAFESRIFLGSRQLAQDESSETILLFIAFV